ncbi:MAG: response regulator, partial [Rhodocyclales bacterium]|nr:response regulator [Rhodocyclales bacterium]
MSETQARILLVDDDADLRRLLTLRLEAAGYSVIAVDCAEKAISTLLVERPQVVVTDMRMPGMDGAA